MAAAAAVGGVAPAGHQRPRVIVLGMQDEAPAEAIVVNVTSRTKEPWSKGLSPFFLGPARLWDGTTAANMENAWQFAKVYPEHTGPDKAPTEAYFTWARAGWSDATPRRFPMGPGAIPSYSHWGGEQLTYVAARMAIYAPLYAELVEKTDAWQRLQCVYTKAVKENKVLALRDFDGHPSIEQFGGDYERVLYNTREKMGHGFVLAMMLEGQRVWEHPYDPTKEHSTVVRS